MLYDQELFKSRHSHHFVGITAVAETRARKKNHTAAGAQLLALQSKPLYIRHKSYGELLLIFAVSGIQVNLKKVLHLFPALRAFWFLEKTRVTRKSC